MRAFIRRAGELLKAYHLASLHFPNIPWKCFPELQADENSCQGINENAKILSSDLPSSSTGNMVAKISQGMVKYSLGSGKWKETISFSTENGRLMAFDHVLLGFQVS